MTGLLRVPVISLRLYTKWSKIVKTGGKLESQGFSFFTVVKISTTMFFSDTETIMSFK